MESRSRAHSLAVQLTDAEIPWEIWQCPGGVCLTTYLESGGDLLLDEEHITVTKSWQPGEAEVIFLREDAESLRQTIEARNAPAAPPPAVETEDPAPTVAVTEARTEFDALLTRYQAETADMPGTKGSRYDLVRTALNQALIRRYADDQAKRIHAAHKAALLGQDDESDEDALNAVFDGDDGGTPTYGHIAGTTRALFYEGSENEIFGSNSTGKSTILTALHADVLRNGGVVVHWEFDNHTKKDHFRRLKNAGVPKDVLKEVLAEGRFHLFHSIDRAGQKVDNVTMVSVDALDPAIVSFGLDTNHPSGTDTVLLKLIRPYTLKGAVGLVLDHTGHENGHRAAGSKRKINAFQGAVYRIECETPLAPGQEGVSNLILAKDNKGGAGIIDHGIATVRMRPESTVGPGPVSVVFEPYDPSSFGGMVPAGRQPDETEPEKYARLLSAYGAEQSITQKNAIELLRKHGAGVSNKHITEGMRLFRKSFDA
ncbi:hypothetical protein ABZ379_10480 [Streptomyces canus]|uniref:hypothetical protein n=1 Tax=Streptomyces canus TaxID=58343 RepID=UPI0033F1CAE7